MQVLKFGGSSVADATRMSQVIDIVQAAVARDRTILVSSAISGCTDALIAISPSARSRIPRPARSRSTRCAAGTTASPVASSRALSATP